MRFLKFTLSLFLVLLSVISAQAEDELHVGSAAPSFTLQDVHQKEIKLNDFVGKKVILHFWAPSCFVCPQELEALTKLQKHFGSELSQIVTVVSFDNSKKSLNAIKEMNAEFPVAIDDKNSVAELFNVRMLPETVLIDEDGKLVAISDPAKPDRNSFQLVGPRDWVSPAAIDSLRKAKFIN